MTNFFRETARAGRLNNYIILASSQLKNSEGTVLVSIDKNLIAWIDQQVQTGKYQDRSQLIEKAIAQYKINARESKNKQV